ncbi:hypothetical protein COLO4_04643 [Corchorus olitorius]|uniref:Uncharacterized protein n=1 Tax=Corchorus olitorius TaxID=93759 RepID=A0A1R3KT86_9ROSI|nr:hypothetical protein COLO4_04643 [Corchorus olitorius]
MKTEGEIVSSIGRTRVRSGVFWRKNPLFFSDELPLESSPEPAILLFLIFRVHQSSLPSSGRWEQVK